MLWYLCFVVLRISSIAVREQHISSNLSLQKSHGSHLSQYKHLSSAFFQDKTSQRFTTSLARLEFELNSKYPHSGYKIMLNVRTRTPCGAYLRLTFDFNLHRIRNGHPHPQQTKSNSEKDSPRDVHILLSAALITISCIIAPNENSGLFM